MAKRSTTDDGMTREEVREVSGFLPITYEERDRVAECAMKTIMRELDDTARTVGVIRSVIEAMMDYQISNLTVSLK